MFAGSRLRRSAMFHGLLIVVVALLIGCVAQTFPPNTEPKPLGAPIPTANTTPPTPTKVDTAEDTPDGFAVSTADGATVIGPYREYTSPLIWVGDDALTLSKERDTALLADLRTGQTHPLPSLKTSGPFALAPDHSSLAWIAEGKVFVRDLATTSDRSWALTSKDHSWGEMLSWSPNGRYLLGQIHPDADIGALWALDIEENKLSGLVNEAHAFLNTQWSPDGNQFIVMEGLRPHSSSPTRQWRWINLLTRQAQVVTPIIRDQRQVQFSWDNKEELITKLVWPGPNETLVIPYDASLKQYQDERDYAIDGTLETELHFLDAQRGVKDRIDLLPALQAAGIPCTPKDRLVVFVYPSPDGRHLYLDGRGSQATAQGAAAMEYRAHGVVDLTTRSVRFLPLDKNYDHSGFGWLENRYRWLGDQVLLAPGVSSAMALLNVETLDLTPIPSEKKVITARCTPNGVVYATHGEVGYQNAGGQKRVMLFASANEELVEAIFSPSGTHLAVTLERRGEGSPTRFVHVFSID